MADKPAPEADHTYSEEETARRRDATIRAMIAMPPKPHRPPAAKPKSRASSKAPVDKRKPNV